MQRVALCFVIGILLLTVLVDLPDERLAILSLPIAAAALIWRKYFWLAVLPLGFLWALFQAHQLNEYELADHLQGENLVISGRVVDVPERRQDDVTFLFKLKPASIAGQRLPSSVRLSWYRSAPPIYAGDHWQLTVRLKRPHGFMNQGGSDREKFLFHNGIQATGYVRDAKPIEVEGNQLLGRSKLSLNRSRQNLARKINAALPDSQVLGPLLALTLGQRDQMTRDQWQVLQNTGTSHLMAISGLHIGLISGLLFWLVRRLWGRSEFLSVRLPAQKAAACAAVLAALAYAAMSGFSLPAQRASIMVATFSLAFLLDRKLAPSYVLAAALILVLLIDPFAVQSAGLWMSFTAVAVLFAVIERNGSGKKTLVWLKVQWLLLLGLLPLSIWYFQQASMLAPLINLVAIPVVGFVVVPLLLVGALFLSFIPSLGKFLLNAGDYVLEHCFSILAVMGESPSVLLALPQPTLSVLLLAITGVALLLAPRLKFVKFVGVVLLLPLFLNRPPGVNEGEFRVDILDVGQGSAYSIQTAHHVMMFDAGPRYAEDFDAGAAIVVPFLRSRGIRALDQVLVSHADDDHIGGLKSILESVVVAEVLMPDPNAFPEHASKACVDGLSWRWDGVEFTVLNPPADFHHDKKNRNNGSCVLIVAGANASMFFTADIEKGAERAILGKNMSLRAQVMTVPHHGSRTSSSRAFIARVSPEVAIVSAGYRNSFGHPKEDVVERYRAQSIEVLETTKTGMLTLHFHKNGRIETQQYRQRKRRYWHRS